MRRVGKAKRAHHSNNALDGGHGASAPLPTLRIHHDFPTKNPTPIAATLSIIASVDSQPSQ